MEPIRGMHKGDCVGGPCEGCWTGENAGAATAPAELVALRVVLEDSNRQRLAAIEGAGVVYMPNFAIGMLELLADYALGIGTVAREAFRIEWARKLEEWIEAQEAEINKARIAMNAPRPAGEERRLDRSALTIVGEARPVVPRIPRKAQIPDL